VAVRGGEADFVPDKGGGIESSSLMTARAAASSFAGEGKEIVMFAVGALHS
jgi:hypothetical protein